MEMANLKQVTKTILTGAFGANFNWKNSISIGMIPRKSQIGQVDTITNAAGLGAVKALLKHVVFIALKIKFRKIHLWLPRVLNYRKYFVVYLLNMILLWGKMQYRPGKKGIKWK